MPRAPRLDGPGVLHHVIARGIERRRIFRTDHDRQDLLARLATGCRRGGASLLAWALLPNHVHALLRSGPVRLSQILQRVLGGYAREFNRRHRRHGHLFQNRFKSIVVEDDPYLLELVRYIHLNPVRAGLVEDVAALDHYPWGGHSRLMGFMHDGWQGVDEVLQLFGGQVGAARRAYRVQRPWLGTLRRDVLPGMRALTLIPVGIYLASYAPWFASETAIDRHMEGRNIGDGPFAALRSLWYYTHDVYRFHSGLTNAAGNHHPWESKPWTWPMCVVRGVERDNGHRGAPASARGTSLNVV